MIRKIVYVPLDSVKEYSAFLNDHRIEFKKITQANAASFYLNGEENKLKMAEEVADEIGLGIMWFKMPAEIDKEEAHRALAIEMSLEVVDEKLSFFRKRKMIAFKGDQRTFSLYSQMLRHAKAVNYSQEKTE